MVWWDIWLGLYWVYFLFSIIIFKVQFSSVQLFVTLMLVGVWLGLLWVLFYFFDHYIQSSVILFLQIIIFKVQFSQFSSVSSVQLYSKFSSVGVHVTLMLVGVWLGMVWYGGMVW